MTSTTVTVLDRPVYGLAEVDRLLRLPAGTAARWVDGYERWGRRYPPVIRLEPTGDAVATWGEFVECSLLAGYRASGVPLVNLRPVVERLRERLGVPYPLAHKRLYVAGRELVERVQLDTGLPSELSVVVRTGQVQLPVGSALELAPPAQRFFEAAEWDSAGDDAVVARLRAPAGADLVLLDPTRSFGSPTVGGVRTDVVAEEVDAGSAVAAVAAGFELTEEQVRAAVAFEHAAA